MFQNRSLMKAKLEIGAAAATGKCSCQHGALWSRTDVVNHTATEDFIKAHAAEMCAVFAGFPKDPSRMLLLCFRPQKNINTTRWSEGEITGPGRKWGRGMKSLWACRRWKSSSLVQNSRPRTCTFRTLWRGRGGGGGKMRRNTAKTTNPLIKRQTS